MGLQDRVDFVRLARRISGRDLWATVQYGLLGLLAFLSARLIWAMIVPIGPVGTLPQAAPATAPDIAIFARFDPFFQMLGDAGPLVVSDLEIDLFGTRVDNASGRGSAIIGAKGRPQQSFRVGEDVLPGVTLHAVAFDSVTVNRRGVLEQLFLDQSIPARPVSASETLSGSGSEAVPVIDRRVDKARFAGEISAEPVYVDGRVDGVAVQPASDGRLFNEIGLQPGDIVLSVNGARIDTKARADNIVDLIGGAAVAAFEIRRGAEVKTLSVEIAQ